MPASSRRGFLQQGAAASAGAAMLSRATRAAAANNALSVGLIGCGGRGVGVAAAMGGISYVCEPDRNRLAQAAKKFDVDSSHAVTDLRRILDDDSVDAVIIASPDHWHEQVSVDA